MKKLLLNFTLLFLINLGENAWSAGFITDSIKTTSTPTLIIQNPNINFTCAGSELKLKYAASENYPTDNIFKFNIVHVQEIDYIQQITRYELGQTTSSSGEITLKIPMDVISRYYNLEVVSSNPNLVKTYNDITFRVLQKPEVYISGNTTINSGSSTLLNLIDNSGGGGWYILSDSTKEKLYYSRLYIIVKPLKTTTYKLLSAYNECGVGKFSGSATVTVNPDSPKKMYSNFEEITRFPEQYPQICSGATYTIKYNTIGEFSPSNKFTVQVSDENGENFKNVITEGTSSPLKFITPDEMKPSNSYRIRVVASDKDVGYETNAFPLLSSRKGPTATFDSSTYFFKEGQTVSIKINLTGKSPWRIIFGSDEKKAVYYDKITSSPYIINVSPNKSISYKIFEVNDGCPGKVIGSAIVKIELITASEELSDLEVKLFPNPTSDKLTIQSDKFKNSTLKIFDNLGRQILQQNLIKSETILDISTFKTGQYLLQIERDNKHNVYKIGKL